MIFLISTILLAFILPVVLSPAPWGTDVYSHMVNTDRMFQSDSLVDFYEKSFSEEYLGYDYPFGMWFFGAVLMKVTGMDIHQMSILFPIAIVFISFVIFYLYALKLLKKEEWAIVSLIFLISMPLISNMILNYSTSRFVVVFLIMILYIVVDENRKWQNLALAVAMVFVLAITHTGTYIFLIFFTASYFLFYALIWKKFDWWMFFITISTIFTYVLAVQEFQFVQPQYIDKGRLVISVSDNIASITGLEIIRDMGNIFYENIFVSNNMSYGIFWSALIFTAGILAIWIHRRFDERIPRYGLSLPLIGDIQTVSHAIVTTPFWIGPVQTVLSAFGFFALDPKGKCIFLGLIIGALVPGSMQSAEGTGSLREIYYLLLIIPIAAAAGLMYLYPKIQGIKSSVLKIGILLIIFLPLIVAPIVGSIHYVPQISGTTNEKENLIWLSHVGEPYEGISGFVYRERIDLYSEKKTPSIHTGTETKRYSSALRRVYLANASEEETAELYSFNIQYLILSNKVIDALEVKPNAIKINTNNQLDKIFSSDDQFGIYHYNSQKLMENSTILANRSNFSENVIYQDQPGFIHDYGSSYLFENNYYKIRLDKKSPSILYYGTPTENMLGEGYIMDSVTLSSKFGQNYTSLNFVVDDIVYDSITQSGNSLEYYGKISSPDDDDIPARIHITYTFYEKCIKREFQIVNDVDNKYKSSSTNIAYATSIFAPATAFDLTDLSENFGEEISRKMYPSRDMIPLKNIKTNRLFIENNGKGLMIKYIDTAPYPDKILYRGSPDYDYGNIYVESRYSCYPGEEYRSTQLIAVGEKDDAIRNIDEYTSVKLYDYPNGIVPLIILDPYSEGDANWSGILNSSFPESSVKSFLATNYSGIKEYNLQYDEISRINDSYSGVIIPNLVYNLDTIHALSDNSMESVTAIPVEAPFYWYNQEGTRNLKEAYYNGEPSGVYLVPVSLPQSGQLNKGYNDDDIFSKWAGAIDSVRENDGIAVFFWNPQDFNSYSSIQDLDKLMAYTENKGMTRLALDTVVHHRLLLKNVFVLADVNVDTISLVVTNNNQESVNGATWKVVLPSLNDTCAYKVSEQGRIVRSENEFHKCTMYIACDLAPGESKQITIEPSIPRKRFGIDFSKLYHGTNQMIVRDDEGNPVDGALIKVDTRSYTSDSSGEVKFYVRRGIHNISIEKPGFRSREVNVYLKGKIFRYLDSILPESMKI